MGLGWAGFSSNAMTRSIASTSITPKAQASSTGTSMQAIVMSAELSMCSASITP